MKITENRALTIALPNTRTLGKGTRVTRGAVAYRGSAGSAAVIPTEKGVQFLAVIDNRQSPSAYAYTVSGGHIELLPGGGAIVRDGDGHPAALVPAPWARDANGAHLKTWFTANGTTLTQHIAHRGHGVTYPVVADPFWIPAWAVAQIIRCGAGGYLGWIAAGGWDWWERALAVAAGCLIGTR
jgi:hypothetical protein